MRLGISSSLNPKNAQEWGEAHSSLSCKSVVFPLSSEASDSEIQEYVQEAKKHDLMIAEVGIWRNAIALDEKERLENLKYSINQLAMAEEIGARCCVNVAGSFGKRWDGGYKENFSKEAWDKTVKMVQTVIDEVKPLNTFFSIEPMPWMIPTGPQEYLDLIDAVGRDRFGVHMDIINMISSYKRYFFHEDFMEETFEKLGKNIKSCHIKDVKLLDGFTFQLKECACGEGDFNLEKYAELINKYDDQMPVIIEHIDSDEKYKEVFKYTARRLANFL